MLHHFIITLPTDFGVDLSHIQALGGNKGVEAMEDAGFKDVTVTRVPIPLYVTPSLGYGDLFAYLASCTSADVSELQPLRETHPTLTSSKLKKNVCGIGSKRVKTKPYGGPRRACVPTNLKRGELSRVMCTGRGGGAGTER